jgi:hypothetical protein
MPLRFHLIGQLVEMSEKDEDNFSVKREIPYFYLMLYYKNSISVTRCIRRTTHGEKFTEIFVVIPNMLIIFLALFPLFTNSNIFNTTKK